MDASNTLAISQSIIVWTLLGLLLVWTILFAVLAFRSPRTKEQASRQSAQRTVKQSAHANTQDLQRAARPRISAETHVLAGHPTGGKTANGMAREVEAAPIA